MNKKMKVCLAVSLVGAFALTSSAEIVGFFHVGANTNEVYNASGGDLQPTELLVTDGSGVYGDLTLTLDAASTQFKLTFDSDILRGSGDPLITSCGSMANDNMWDNGVRMDDVVGNLTLTNTLSGLTIGQEYRLQYTATMRYTDSTGAERYEGIDLTTTVGTASANATYVAQAPGIRDMGVISSYLEWTAASTTLDLIFAASGSSDDKLMSGIIVESIPEPATLGLMVGVGGGMFFLRRRLKI
jgi:hypothetical protein